MSVCHVSEDAQRPPEEGVRAPVSTVRGGVSRLMGVLGTEQQKQLSLPKH